MALFARSFLELPRRAPRLDKLVIATSAFAFLYTAVFEGFQSWSYPEWLWDYGDLLAASFMFCTLLFCGVVLLRRGMTTARFYIIGLSGYLLGTVCSFARSIPSVEAFFGVLPWPLTDPGQLGVAWEALFFDTAYRRPGTKRGSIRCLGSARTRIAATRRRPRADARAAELAESFDGAFRSARVSAALGEGLG